MRRPSPRSIRDSSKMLPREMRESLKVPPTRAGEKSILLRTCRYRRGNPVPAEAWFEIKPTRSGTVAEEIFQNLSKDFDLEILVDQSNCALIGSHLYVIGGRRNCEYSDTGRRNCQYSTTVRRLNVRNPDGGWKACKPLPSPSARATVGVAGDLIYLFPMFSPEGIVYDTSCEKGSAMKTPPILIDLPAHCTWKVPFCVPLYGAGKKGVLAPLLGGQGLTIYNPDEDIWKKDSTFPMLPSLDTSDKYTGYAVLNGKFYLSYCNRRSFFRICAYCISTGACLVDVELPRIRILGFHPVYDLCFVAVADYELCYLWSRGSMYHKCIQVCLVRVMASPGCSSPIVSEEELFDVEADSLKSCIAFDNPNEEICYWPPIVENTDCNPSRRTPNLMDEMRLSLENEKQILAQDNLKLVEENKRLLQRLKALEASSSWKQKPRFFPKNRSRALGVPPRRHNSNMAFSGPFFSGVNQTRVESCLAECDS